MLHATAFSQEDGYLSESGTNDKTIIKKNKITIEVVCNYCFCKSTKGISVFSDLSKIILIDSVTVYYDENGNMTQRIRINKKNNSTLVDSFSYTPDNKLVQISSTSILNGQETDMGYKLYTYDSSGRISLYNEAYVLPNGITKDGLVQNVYNRKNQLVEVWKQSNISKLVLCEKYSYYIHGRIKKIDNYNDDYSTKFKYCCRTTNIFSTNFNEYYHKSKIVYNRHHQCVKYLYGDKINEFKYNNDGTLAESNSHYDGNMISITQHQYYKGS